MFNHFRFNSLPERLKQQVDRMPINSKRIFLQHYMRKCKSPLVAYLSMSFGGHYAYLRRWDDQLFFYLTLGGIGLWWVSDIFRLRDMVYQYNASLARNILKDMHSEL